MLTLPEFQNIELTHKVLKTLEESKILLNVLSGQVYEKRPAVIIGKESHVDSLEDCSMVIAPYTIEDQAAGVMSVLGPKRMAYQRIIPIIKSISKQISDYFKKETE